MKNILVLPGGGAMGLAQLNCLAKIEQLEGKSISDIYTLIIGTSVGSINGGVLASGISANEFVDIFYNSMDDIFRKTRLWALRRKPKYNRLNFNKVFNKVIGNDFKMKSCKTDFICTSVNRVTNKNRFFKSNKSDETLLSCITRSYAAPLYFGQVNDELNGAVWFDGGTGTANMPLDWAITECIKRGMDLNDVRITCVGTGYPKNTDTYEKLSKQSNTKQVLDYMSPSDGGFARVQIIEDQLYRAKILEDSLDGFKVQYIDTEFEDKHIGMDLTKYKDEYMQYGLDMYKKACEAGYSW